VLDIVVHRNIRLSNVIASDILDSDHLPIVFNILDHDRTTKLSEPTEKFTDWERFQSLASDLISPRIEINSGVKADKAARDFSASIASAFRLSPSKITISELNNDSPGLECLLNYKKRLRKLWQGTRDPECKTALNWVSKSIRPAGYAQQADQGTASYHCAAAFERTTQAALQPPFASSAEQCGASSEDISHARRNSAGRAVKTYRTFGRTVSD
jgi:hypothetical protein